MRFLQLELTPSNKKRLKGIILISLFVLPALTGAQANEWIPVKGAEPLKNFMSNMKAERTLAGGEISRGEYHSDGTGTLYTWGTEIPRTWEVKGDDQICVTGRGETICYQLEHNSNNPNLFRFRDVATGKVGEFEVTEKQAIVKAQPKDADSKGGAATPSAGELAAELSNPNTAVATLNFKNQFRWFEGDLPDADDQSSYMMLFQPILPFVLSSGDKIIWRPAIPLLVDQPVFELDEGGFGGVSGMGDIVFDIAYAPKRDDNLLFALGLVTSLPTATDDSLGTDRWTLGPEFLIGMLRPKHVMGLLPTHQWDVAGSGDADVNLTMITAFYTYLPGGGWSVGTGPIITYDWVGEQWTVPLQLNTGKTVMLGGRPWKLSVELNYYIEKSEAFGPEWMLGLNIAPVVKNGLASWFGLGKK